MNNGGDVYVYNKSKEAFVATEVSLANTYWRRLVGLLGKTRKWIHPGHGLWIVPSHGVHTIGMLFPIDLVFLDQARRVVHLAEHVRPFVISRVCLKAHSVLELPPHTIFRSGTEVGDQLVIGSLRAVSGTGRSRGQSQDDQMRTHSVSV
jgi:uncharacterized protein